MKKILSVALALIMLVSLFVPAVYAIPHNNTTDCPTLYFRGNGETIYDEDGNAVYDFDVDSDTIKSIAKTVLPSFTKGYLTGNFDEYYKVFGEEMTKLYDRCLLDNNGNPRYGTGISDDLKALIEKRKVTDYKNSNGQYLFDAYTLPYDWRLDPLATADIIDEFIDCILETTGAKKVNLMSKCLGGNLILAYIAKYGTEKINGIGFGSTVAFGQDLASEVYSGHVDFDSETITRFAKDKFASDLLSNLDSVVSEFITDTLELANISGAGDVATNATMKLLINRLYKGLIPVLVTTTYGTWPGYWSMVTADRYQEAKTFVFGDENSEKYQTYAGLIAKLDNYDTLVRQHIPELLTKAKDNGVKICIVSKYGFQMPPITDLKDEQGDVWVSAKYSSLGATVSKAGSTLSDDYIAERTALGYADYISPDKQIDASTCVLPEYTWFIKNAVHNEWTKEENSLMTYVFNYDGQATVNDIDGASRFMVYDRENDVISPMTTENCDTETYEVDEDTSFIAKIQKFFKAIIKWLKTTFNFLKYLSDKK